jgi:hypothetical protein
MIINQGSAVVVFTAGCLLLPAIACAVPVVGQVDTFEDGSTQGWIINLLGIGSPPAAALPTNIATGGPGGADDNFLQLTSLGGAGAGNRLVAINVDPRWTGNYIAAGVNAITMDVNNLGSTDLSLRLLFEHAAGGPPTDTAISTNPVLVSAGSGWTQVTFLIGVDDLTAGVGDVSAALSDVSIIRIFHSPVLQFPGPSLAAQIGVDNITAVPEPSTLALAALGILGMLALGAGTRTESRPTRDLRRPPDLG